MNLTQKEQELTTELKAAGASYEIANLVLNALRTEALQEQMIDFLVERYQGKGKVTEQDILKAVIILTGDKKTPEQIAKEKRKRSRLKRVCFFYA